MTTSPTAAPRRLTAARVGDVVQYVILAVIVVAALAGAFTHMHDWTISSLDGALESMHSDRRTSDWIGWANAVISELLPTSSFLSIRKRQQQGRSPRVPVLIFVGSAGVSMVAQLSATGIDIPGAAQFLACLPAVSVMILAKVIFSDIEHSGKVRATAELAAEQAAAESRREAELRAERDAELARERAERDAELAEQRERREREHEAKLARDAARLEQAAITQRLEIEAAERAAERAAAAAERRAERETAAAERRRAQEVESRQAAAAAEAQQAAQVEAARIAAQAEAERVRVAAEAEALVVAAEAARVEAEAAQRRAAAERLAALPVRPPAAEPGRQVDADRPGRVRRDRQETAALVGAVLLTLPGGTDRAAAVNAVAESLSVTTKYARAFVPEGFVAGASSAGGAADAAASSARGRHLAAV